MVLGLLVHVTPSIFFRGILRSEALDYKSYVFFRTAVLRSLFKDLSIRLIKINQMFGTSAQINCKLIVLFVNLLFTAHYHVVRVTQTSYISPVNLSIWMFYLSRKKRSWRGSYHWRSFLKKTWPSEASQLFKQ